MSSNEKFEREFDAFLNEEDSRLAALYRKLPETEPDPRLDAAVRAMAHRALNPQLVATPRAPGGRRRAGRWITMLGAAAGVVLAAGIAFRLGPSVNDTNYRDASGSDAISVRQLDAPASATPPPLSPAPPPASLPATDAALARSAQGKPKGNAPAMPLAPPALGPVVAAKAARLEEQAQRPAATLEQRSDTAVTGGHAQGVAKAKPSPRPFPPELDHGRPLTTRQVPEIDAVERKQIMATGASRNLHDRDADKAAEQDRSLDDKADRRAAPPPAATAAPSSAADVVPPPAADVSAPPSAPPTAAERSFVPSPVQSAASPAPSPPPLREVPSATTTAPAAPPAADAVRRDEPANASEVGALKKERAKSADPNARLYPEHWLANIRTMLENNHRDEALRSLAEFRRLYPDYVLPDDLRDLK